jgi:hypothetical protein
MQSTCCGSIVDQLPDGLPLLAKTRVTVSEFPIGQAAEFPPYYKKSYIIKRRTGEDEVPVRPTMLSWLCLTRRKR